MPRAHGMASTMTPRWSRLGRPTRGFCGGRGERTRSHSAASVSGARGTPCAVCSVCSVAWPRGASGDYCDDVVGLLARRVARWQRPATGPGEPSATATIPAGTPVLPRGRSSPAPDAAPPPPSAGSARGKDPTGGSPFVAPFSVALFSLGRGAQYRQVGVGQEGQRGVPVPAVPLPHLVLSSRPTSPLACSKRRSSMAHLLPATRSSSPTSVAFGPYAR